LTRNPLKNLRR